MIERPSLLKKSPTGSASAGVTLIPTASNAASITNFFIMTFTAPTLCTAAARSSIKRSVALKETRHRSGGHNTAQRRLKALALTTTTA